MLGPVHACRRGSQPPAVNAERGDATTSLSCSSVHTANTSPTSVSKVISSPSISILPSGVYSVNMLPQCNEPAPGRTRHSARTQSAGVQALGIVGALRRGMRTTALISSAMLEPGHALVVVKRRSGAAIRTTPTEVVGDLEVLQLLEVLVG